MRLLLLSDLHGSLPVLPPQKEWDLCLIAGDICPDLTSRYMVERHERAILQARWMNTTFDPWLPILSFFTWGNHDRVGVEFPHLLTRKLQNRIMVDRLLHVGGDDLSIWFSPWSNSFGWTQAFMKEPHLLAAHYDLIPKGTDVIVSHAPPYGILDTVAPGAKHLGSRELLLAIDYVRPKVVVCGHIHGGYGRGELFMPDGEIVEVRNVSHMTEQYAPLNRPIIVEVT